MTLVLLSLIVGSPPVAAPDVAVVCPAEFRAALAPWVAHRTAQGHTIAWVDNRQSKHEIRQAVRRLAKQGRLTHVVLVGDAPEKPQAGVARRRLVPTYLAKAKVNIHWGSEPEIATDNWYADLDDDAVPDVAIGRISADSPQQLAGIVRKTLQYEQSTDFGPWRRRVNFVAGVGGFGAIADGALEFVTKKLITDMLPSDYRTSMTYASWRSPYCPDPRLFAASTRDRLNEGCLFWVYIGHGHVKGLDRVQVPGANHRIFDHRDVPALECKRGHPIAFFMSCYTGAFDREEDCLAEEMVRVSGGPVAVIAGSRVTMPYAMAILGHELMHAYTKQRCNTIGRALLQAKRQVVLKKEKDGTRATIDLLAKAISPAPDKLADERAEHLLLFNLIGDPLLRLKHPKQVKLAGKMIGTAGKPLEIAGESEIAGRAPVEVVARRDRLRFVPAARASYQDSPKAREKMQAEYSLANDARWSMRTTAIEQGNFTLRIDLPANVSGPCHVRVFVEGNNDFAMGAADVAIAASPDDPLSE